jgi:hypothetical protein
MEEYDNFLLNHVALFVTKRKQLCVGLCAAFTFAGWQLLRDMEAEKPTLSLLIPGYMICLCLAILTLKLYYILQECDPPEWDPVMFGSQIWRLVLLAFLTAASLVLARTSRMLAREQEIAWTLDIWVSHVPFWVAVISGIFREETWVISLGTSLALTCASVLMLPLYSFKASLLMNITAALHVIAKSAALVTSYRFMNKNVFQMPNSTLPIQMVINMAATVPLFLLFVVGFTETNLLIEYVEKPLMEVLGDAMLHGIVLFSTTTALFYLQTMTSPLFCAVVYSLGSNIATLARSWPSSVMGFSLVVFTLFLHMKFIYYEEKKTPYRGSDS